MSLSCSPGLAPKPIENQDAGVCGRDEADDVPGRRACADDIAAEDDTDRCGGGGCAPSMLEVGRWYQRVVSRGGTNIKGPQEPIRYDGCLGKCPARWKENKSVHVPECLAGVLFHWRSIEDSTQAVSEWAQGGAISS
jgi:hypothetical protein